MDPDELQDVIEERLTERKSLCGRKNRRAPYRWRRDNFDTLDVTKRRKRRDGPAPVTFESHHGSQRAILSTFFVPQLLVELIDEYSMSAFVVAIDNLGNLLQFGLDMDMQTGQVTLAQTASMTIGTRRYFYPELEFERELGCIITRTEGKRICVWRQGTLEYLYTVHSRFGLALNMQCSGGELRLRYEGEKDECIYNVKDGQFQGHQPTRKLPTTSVVYLKETSPWCMVVAGQDERDLCPPHSSFSQWIYGPPGYVLIATRTFLGWPHNYQGCICLYHLETRTWKRAARPDTRHEIHDLFRIAYVPSLNVVVSAHGNRLAVFTLPDLRLALFENVLPQWAFFQLLA